MTIPLCHACSGTGATRGGAVCSCPAGEETLASESMVADYDDVTAYELAMEMADGDGRKASRIAREWERQMRRIAR